MEILTEDEAEEGIRRLPPSMWSMFERFLPMIVPTYSLEEVLLCPGDKLVLCTDGISDYVQPEEIRQLLEHAPSEGIDQIIHLARGRAKAKNSGSYDDLTLLVYEHE